MSKHAEAARMGLHAAAHRIAADVALPEGLRDRAADVLMDGTDMDSAARLTAHLLLCAEDSVSEAAAAVTKASAAHDHARRATEAVEAALTAFLEETGAPSIDAGSHTLSVAAGRPAVLITNMDALPAAYLRPQPPKPDKIALAAALKAGAVPGAELSNGRPTLRRTLKEKSR